MGSELHVSECLTFEAKITSTRIAWLDDSAKISRRELQAFYRKIFAAFIISVNSDTCIFAGCVGYASRALMVSSAWSCNFNCTSTSLIACLYISGTSASTVPQNLHNVHGICSWCEQHKLQFHIILKYWITINCDTWAFILSDKDLLCHIYSCMQYTYLGNVGWGGICSGVGVLFTEFNLGCCLRSSFLCEQPSNAPYCVDPPFYNSSSWTVPHFIMCPVATAAPNFLLLHGPLYVLPNFQGAAASSRGSAVSCKVEGRAIDTALGQCFIPNSSH